MLKKIYNICFIAIFLLIIAIPAVCADWSGGGVSEDENRNLAPLPELAVDGCYNDDFTSECEIWFMDHMGFRKNLINFNATIQYKVFERIPESSNYYLGKNNDINYATNAMIMDYAHLNLRSDYEVEHIGNSYQTIHDWLENKGIQFYYVQCWDKHSIYPEQFISSVNQIGDISKTDQVISYLKNNTTVNTISLKEVLVDSKNKYEVYSNWGDPTHWTDRGAYIGYKYIMQEINKRNNNMFRILEEKDYNITISDKGITLNGFLHKEDMLETFSVKKPQAKKVAISDLSKFANDTRHSIWKNENANNDTKLLLMCDSYINDFIISDIAESFSEVWLVWGDYTTNLDTVVDMYNPDIVIYECAERVDRSFEVKLLANKLKQ